MKINLQFTSQTVGDNLPNTLANSNAFPLVQNKIKQLFNQRGTIAVTQQKLKCLDQRKAL